MGDPGISNERTALAWQRTALSLIAGSAIVTRLTWSTLGLWALAILSAVTLLSLWVFVEGTGRYSHDAGIRARPRSRGGRAPLVLASGAGLLSASEILAFIAG